MNVIFDTSLYFVTKGSTVRYQYPNPIAGYKEDWFAEHMLPEGAHNREQDWTYIILNRGERHIDEVSRLKEVCFEKTDSVYYMTELLDCSW